MRHYFGTDGIRGRVGEDPITAEFALKLGWAIGHVMSTTPSRSFVIGKDTRISGYMFESALEAGLSAAGANIKLLGPMPTPAIAWLTRSMRASAGIVISASHNPHHDNGFKFFSADGEKLPDADERAIEAAMEEPFETVASDRLGKAERVDDAAGRYIEFCKSRVGSGVSLAGLKLVVDCAHGATYHVAPRVFRELGADVVAIGVQPDGLNINRGCGSTDLEQMRRAVLDHSADLGIAFDGDGDRTLMVDHSGRPVDGDELLFIIARARHETGHMVGGVVGTLMTNLGFEHALAEMGLPFARAQVGDRYVHQMLKQRGWIMGGEASGHLLLLDKTTTGDGIVSALAVLEVIAQAGQPLAELRAGFQKYPQCMINVPVNGRVDLDSNTRLEAALATAEKEMGANGRVILRPSGTEPVVRVTVEGRDRGQVDEVTRRLAQVVEEEFAGQ